MGRLIARFSGCNPAALVDVAGLVRALRRATAAAGATTIRSVEERFAPDGFLATIVTPASEARLRTIPEKAACFVEFRCADGRPEEAFATVLGTYLHAPYRRQPVPIMIHPTAPDRRAEAAAASGSA